MERNKSSLSTQIMANTSERESSKRIMKTKDYKRETTTVHKTGIQSKKSQKSTRHPVRTQHKEVMERNRSSPSTLIMANTSEKERAKRIMKTKDYEHETKTDHNADTQNKKSQKTTPSKDEKNGSSLLGRLTIVNTESSSRRKNKSRRHHHHRCAERDDQPYPEELVVSKSLQETISMLPYDSYSVPSTSHESYTPASKTDVDDPVPELFTFDLVPSISEDTSSAESERDYGEIDNNSTDTTDANFNPGGVFDEDDDESESSVDDRPVQKKVSATAQNKKHNMDTLAALGKLELSSRTRTESTAFLSETSSYETPLRMADEDYDDASTVFETKKQNKHIHEKASRCIGFNIFSIFE